MVKCLYLFFDLPKIRRQTVAGESPDGVASQEVDENQRIATQVQERRSALHQVFSQALTRICKCVRAAEDIVAQDDLSRLFGIVTMCCAPHNRSWRKTASDVLIAIAHHSLSRQVVDYVNKQGCITMCVRNMHTSLNRGACALEVVEMFVAISCFLKDSSELSYPAPGRLSRLPRLSLPLRFP